MPGGENRTLKLRITGSVWDAISGILRLNLADISFVHSINDDINQVEIFCKDSDIMRLILVLLGSRGRQISTTGHEFKVLFEGEVGELKKLLMDNYKAIYDGTLTLTLV